MSWLHRKIINPVASKSGVPRIHILSVSFCQLIVDWDKTTSTSQTIIEVSGNLRPLSHDYLVVALSSTSMRKKKKEKNRRQEENNGLNWTVLLVSLKSRQCYHFDSLSLAGTEAERIARLQPAEDFMANLMEIFDQKGKKGEMTVWCIRPERTLQDSDPMGVNSGPIVCCLSRLISTRICETEVQWGFVSESSYWDLEPERINVDGERLKISGLIGANLDLQSVITVTGRRG